MKRTTTAPMNKTSRRRGVARAGVLSLAGCLALATPPAGAAPGDLDPSFGQGGTVVHDFSAGKPDSISDIAVQPDGKIAGGRYHQSGGWPV